MEERITTPPIGIDLGTTNSCVGVWREGWVEIIPNQLGNRTTPSCVAFTNTRRYIGEDAECRANTDPCNTILNVKRLIGNRFSSTNVEDDIKLLPFKVVLGPGDQPLISVRYQGEEKQFSAIEITSMVLRNLYDTAEDFLKCPIKNVVISVPACFNDSQRLATVYAGNIAGLNVKRIINEPTAAAIAYGLDNIKNNDGRKKKKHNILIFDLGGGTLDVSILTIEKGNCYKVKATAGDAHLGGMDFDDRLIKHCIDKLELEKKGHLNVNSSPKALAKLRTSCEKAKKVLSVVEETQIEIDSLLPDIDFDYRITRAKFEELNQDLFKRCIDIVEKCLQDAKMYKSSIHDIVPIGGSTRIPKVQQMLQEFFNKGLSTRINADEAVACGAAIQAAILSGMSNKLPDMVQDITTHSLGIDIPKNVFMIPRNRTVIPITVEVAQIKYPIKVYEGENTKIQDNNLLGEFTMMTNANPLAPDVVYLKVDENGIFSIEAEEKEAGQKKNGTMQITRDFMPELSKEDIEKMATEAKKLKSEEDKYRKKLEAKNALEKLINHLSKSNPNKSKLDLVAKEKVEDVSEKTMQWLKENAQAIRVEFVDEYRELVNCLEKTLDGAGVGNMHSSPTPSNGTLTNSDTSLDDLVSRVEKLNKLIRNSSEASHFGRGC